VTGRADKKYATEACSKRARRRAVFEQPETVMPPSTTIADALREELVELGVVRKAEAAIALQLARQLDGGSVVGSQYVALSKELDRRVAALRLMGERPDDPVSAIRRRLAAHRLEIVREESS
jgi:ABC-type glutathione transport system ATPase component